MCLNLDLSLLAPEKCLNKSIKEIKLVLLISKVHFENDNKTGTMSVSPAGLVQVQ